MKELSVKRFEAPDEERPFVDHGHLDIVKFGDVSIGRAVFEPGWRWSKDVGPIAKTASCQAAHTSFCLSGRMRIVMDDGRDIEVGPGDAYVIPPGHDAWVLGDEPCVMLDFTGFTHFAEKGAGEREAEAVVTH